MLRRGAVALCLIAIGCGATGAPRRAETPADREALGATHGWNWDASLDCDDEGCLDWLPAPMKGWSIYGYVLDRETRQPVADATVIATERATGRRARSTSNPLGQFHFGPLAAGRYDIVIVRDGARDRWPDVVLEPGRRTALRIHTGSAEK